LGGGASALSGGTLAFVSDRSGTDNIWTINSDGTGLTQLTSDGVGYNFQPDWSPDGTKIIWEIADGRGNDYIWKMNTDGSGKTKLMTSVGNRPSWSPDGTKIIFRSQRTNYNGWFYEYVMNSDGTGQTLLGSEGTECDQDWSPDSQKIVYAMAGYAGLPSDIYVMNIDGTQKVKIASGKIFCNSNSWSPDGTKIAYSSEETGNREIFVINPDGTGKTQLTNNPFQDDFRPDLSSFVPRKTWSPDSQKIVFVSNRNGNWDIYSIKRDGSGITQLTNDAAKEYAAQWSPDGTKIAYISDKSGKNAIWVMNSDGSNQAQVTDNVGNVNSLVWSPIATPTPSPHPDLIVSSVKPIQVVYDSNINGDDRIDLVAGKSTAVLTNIVIENSELLNGDATVDIRLYLDGNVINTITKTVNQLKSKGQVEFYFTPTISGDHDIHVKVDPDGKIEESKEDNNEKTSKITVKDTNGLYLVYIPVDRTDFHTGYGPLNMISFSETVGKSGEFISATYPIAGDKFINQPTSTKYYGDSIPCYKVGQKETCIGIIDDLISVSLLGEKSTESKADRSVGIVPNDYFTYHNLAGTTGVMYSSIPGGVLVEEGNWAVTAHEIGHTYKLHLNPEEYTSSPPGNTASGFWAAKQKEILNGICFMGFSGNKYSFDYSPGKPEWIDNEDYKHLFEQFRVNKADPEILLVNGILYKDGTMELGSWYRLESGIVDNVIPGDYSIQILDKNGQIISDTNFDMPFMMNVDPLGYVETDVTGFSFAIPYPEGASKVILKHNEQVLTEIDPNTKLLHDAIDAIPDYGFIKNPKQNRNALQNKVDEVEVKINEGNILDARNKLKFDIRDKLEKWLVNDYQKETPLQYSKTEILNLVDEIINRLNP